jgi:hypothetical protein
MSDWYYAQNNQQQGPAPLEKLKEMASAGQLRPEDLIWTAGMAQWAAAGTVEEIFAAAAQPPVAQVATSLDFLAMAGAQHEATRAAAGLPPSTYLQQVSQRQRVSNAMTGMIFSIVSILICGWILAPIGLVLSVKARNRLREAGEQDGQGMAQAGIIIGIVVCALHLVLLVIVIGVIMSR